jgi:hypothetical protein
MLMKTHEPDSRMNVHAKFQMRIDRTRFLWAIGGAVMASVVAAAWGLGVLPAPLTSRSAAAATKPKFAQQPADTVGAAQKDGVPRVKLSYLSASWLKVFQDLADAGELELVVDELPNGRFSRRDSTMHTIKDAMRIINKETERAAADRESGLPDPARHPEDSSGVPSGCSRQANGAGEN